MFVSPERRLKEYHDIGLSCTQLCLGARHEANSLVDFIYCKREACRVSLVHDHVIRHFGKNIVLLGSRTERCISFEMGMH